MSGTDIDHHNSPVAATSSPAEASQVAVDRGVIDLRAPVTTEIERSIRAYRDAHSLSGGPFPQVQGLLAGDIRRALADPRTITGELAPAHGSPVRVPVLVPLELIGWYSNEFPATHFESESAEGATFWHLSAFPGLDDPEFRRVVVPALRDLTARRPGSVVVFADHADRADDPSGWRLSESMEMSAVEAVEQPLWQDGPAREHYFVGRLVLSSPGQRLHASDGRTVATGPTTDDQFVDELWSIYHPPFARLGESTPLRTYFDRSELAEVIAQNGVMQVAHRSEGRLVSWTMMTTRITSFPWMDPSAIYAAEPDVGPDRVHVFPGLVTDEHYRGNHCAELLFNETLVALGAIGPEHLIVFETLDANASFLPKLIEDAVASSGYGKLEFRELGTQVLRAWRL